MSPGEREAATRQGSGTREPAQRFDPSLAEATNSAPAAAGADATDAHCRKCGHRLFKPVSVARLLGPVCLVVVGGELDA